MINLLTPELIQRGGSKLETTRLIIERGLPIPTPRSTWLYHGERLDPILPEVQKIFRGGGRLIVRGSHPSDYHWSIDAIHTERNVTSIEGVGKAIEKIEAGVRGDDFRLHCEDGGVPYSEAVHVLIQQQLDNPVLGSMLRNPHRDYIHIECRDTSKDRSDGLEGTVKHIDVGSVDTGAIWHFGFGLPLSTLVNDIYIPFAGSGIPDAAYVQQVEFGLPGFFLQARPAFKRVPKAEFNIDTKSLDKTPCISCSSAFGITPPEGIEIAFTTLHEQQIGGYENDNNCGRQGSVLDVGKNGYWPGKQLPREEYGMFLLSALQQSPNIRYRLGRLKVFVSFFANDFGHYLEHSSYRFMKKADISLIGARFNNYDPLFSDFENEFARCRVFSNGQDGLIVPSKYLN